MILVLMGVSGSGKTTIGLLAAQRLQWPFVDGDDLHPAANIEKMSHGVPLTDADRWPWLERVRDVMRQHDRDHQDLIIACSALKQSYRDYLGENLALTWIYLAASPQVLKKRLLDRPGHFMKADMLESQLQALEPPADAIIVSVEQDSAKAVSQIVRAIGRS